MRLYQGESADVVALLQQLSSGPAPVEQLVRQNLMLGIAQVRLGHAPLSRKALDAAEALHPQGELHAEMLAAEGSVALYQGRLAEAKRYFDACLIEAQQQHLTFLELQMWNNRASVAAGNRSWFSMAKIVPCVSRRGTNGRRNAITSSASG